MIKLFNIRLTAIESDDLNLTSDGQFMHMFLYRELNDNDTIQLHYDDADINNVI